MERREESVNISPTSMEQSTNNQNSDGDGNDNNIKSSENKWEHEWGEDIEEHIEGSGNDTIGAEEKNSKDVHNRRLHGVATKDIRSSTYR